jgi:septum site-determining protein MinD
MKSLALHSYKGGTGRTTISANIAALLAKDGNNVAILDMDFWSPTIHTIFRTESKSAFVHEYLSGEIDYHELFTDLTSAFDLPGRLLVGVGDSRIDVIRQNLEHDREWYQNALARLLYLKEKLSDEGIDYFIMDCSPGIHSCTVNAIVACDLTLVLCRVNNFDIDGTIQLREGLYKRLDKETTLLFNMVPSQMMQKSRLSQVEETIEESCGQDSVISGYLQYYPEIPLGMGVEIHALTQPSLGFVTDLKMVVSRLSIVANYATSTIGEQI